MFPGADEPFDPAPTSLARYGSVRPREDPLSHGGMIREAGDDHRIGHQVPGQEPVERVHVEVVRPGPVVDSILEELESRQTRLGEREVVQALLSADTEHHLIRAGDVILADKGFAGAQFEAFLNEQLGVHLLRPDRKDEPARFGKLTRVRQWIEAIIGTTKSQLTLEHHGGRTLAGVYARVGARLLALATAIWHNWRTGAPVKRSLIAYDH